MTALGRVLIATSVLACGIIYGTDVFSAIVLRPALALVDDRTLVSIMGRVHDFGDRRLRVPGVAGLAAAILETAVIAWAGTWPRLSLAPSRWSHWRAGSSFTLGSARRSTPPSGRAKAACFPPASCERLF